MDRLDALKVFCAVVDAGGFSRAAAKLGISTSSVTHQIALLEAHFGVKLLNRTTRSMSLTDEGRQCIEQARRLLDDMQELESGLSDTLHEPRGSLRVDMPGILAQRYVAPALPRFLAAYPELSVRLTASDRLIDMVDEGVDVMLRIGELQDSSLVGRSIFKTSMSALRHRCLLRSMASRRIRMPGRSALPEFRLPQGAPAAAVDFQQDGQPSRSRHAAPWPWTMWIR
jgi:LysR family transcriptional regulator for bpeEF and oprC